MPRRGNWCRSGSPVCSDPGPLLGDCGKSGEVIRTLSLADAGLRPHTNGVMSPGRQVPVRQQRQEGRVHRLRGGKAGTTPRRARARKRCATMICSPGWHERRVEMALSRRSDSQYDHRRGRRQVLFVECRHPEIKTLATSRIDRRNCGRISSSWRWTRRPAANCGTAARHGRRIVVFTSWRRRTRCSSPLPARANTTSTPSRGGRE